MTRADAGLSRGKLDGEAPILLTFLAPAHRCNQRCPACIIDRLEEPVDQFTLSPDDYREMTEQVLTSGLIPLLVSFQGYEVTLPRSWPYVESVFASAMRHDVPRSFITNGMLLAKYVDPVRRLRPRRIAVSLDGSESPVNDAIRGVRGAFDTTVENLERFLGNTPELADSVAVASTLYSQRNYESLRSMPRLLRRLGIRRWALGFELEVRRGVERPVQCRETLVSWLRSLRECADADGVRFHVNDEFGFFGPHESDSAVLHAKRLFDPQRVVRVDPLGTVRVGHEVVTKWRSTTRRWRPGQDDMGALIREALQPVQSVRQPPKKLREIAGWHRT